MAVRFCLETPFFMSLYYTECLHDNTKSGTRAFKVKIKEGIFTVINYTNKDTEIYWLHGTVLVNPHSDEYKAANKAVSSFLETVSKTTKIQKHDSD